MTSPFCRCRIRPAVLSFVLFCSPLGPVVAAPLPPDFASAPRISARLQMFDPARRSAQTLELPVRHPDGSEHPWRLHRALEQPDVQVLAWRNLPRGARLAVSPAGQLAVSIPGLPGELHTIGAQGNPLAQTGARLARLGRIVDLAWHPQSNELLVLAAGGAGHPAGLYQVRMPGTWTQLAALPVADGSRLEVSRSGTLAVLTGGRRSQVVLMDAKAARLRTFDDLPSLHAIAWQADGEKLLALAAGNDGPESTVLALTLSGEPAQFALVPAMAEPQFSAAAGGALVWQEPQIENDAPVVPVTMDLFSVGLEDPPPLPTFNASVRDLSLDPSNGRLYALVSIESQEPENGLDEAANLESGDPLASLVDPCCGPDGLGCGTTDGLLDCCPAGEDLLDGLSDVSFVEGAGLGGLTGTTGGGGLPGGGSLAGFGPTPGGGFGGGGGGGLGGGGGGDDFAGGPPPGGPPPGPGPNPNPVPEPSSLALLGLGLLTLAARRNRKPAIENPQSQIRNLRSQISSLRSQI